ncbi:MAG: hypothetical protein K940chlam9_00149 [Chlamydiae bacterium]|nr:hypothetical protein [Chlamydiota bacterium]
MIMGMRAFAFLVGIILLVVGVGGFIPNIVPEDRLVKIFKVNVWTNSLHVATGICAFVMALLRKRGSHILFLRITGITYGIWAILGFIYGENEIFGIIANNSADTWFHVIIALAGLILGFAARKEV